jgi:hypothetical protein
MKGHVAFRYGGHCTFTNRKVKQLAATDPARSPRPAVACRDFRVLSRVNPSTLSAMKRACQRQTTGFDLLERRMISLVPHVGRGEDDLGAPDVFLRRAAVRNNRLKAAAIRRRQFLLSCRELELLRRCGNRPNESDH